ncbi:MAG: tryptophan-rich sensory protein [Oscillospiraceae bacterium]|nr:tryptophan-rich sensory protein [Oscillospiraceae bacterium]
MKQSKWKMTAAFVLLTELVGGLSGFLTRKGSKVYQATIRKPPLSPPGVVFPIVWGILFALMGIGAARIWRAPPSQERTRSLRLFFTQLGFNFFWSIIFFNLQAFGFALLWLAALWVLIVMMINSFRKVDRLAALLQIPYLLWVSFAAYLNFGVWRLNR